MKQCTFKKEPAVVNPLFAHPDEKRIRLSGDWRFRLDPGEAGVSEKWFQYPYMLLENILVPGCWQGQGFGDDSEVFHKEVEVKIRTYKSTYIGTGWYGKVFTVPSGWDGQRIWLNFGGVSPSAELWLNGEKLGEHHSPLVPFAYDITSRLIPGGENYLAVRVHEEDRLMELEYYSEGMWSGLYRDVELTATGPAWIDQLSVVPDADAGQVLVKATLGFAAGGADEAAGAAGAAAVTGDAGEGGSDGAEIKIALIGPDGRECASAHAKTVGGRADLEIKIDQPQLWCPETPNLYRIEARLFCGGELCDVRTDRFGLVKLSTQGKHFLINNQPYFMRGGGEFFVMADTGSPDTNRDSWRKRLGTLRQYGYTYIRLQSHAQIPEYYDAADEAGLLIQSEMGTMGPICGMSSWHTYNMYPKPTPDYRERLRHQWNKVVERDVNHPSANLYNMSNELTPDMALLFPKVAWRCYQETKERKPTALVIWTDGQYSPDLPGDYVNAEASVDADCPKPLIQHEFRWWSSYIDVRTAVKFKGVMRPYGIELVLKAAARNNLSHILIDATKNSQRLQFLEMKGKLEGCRRDNQQLAGISHFNATDTALSSQGVLDLFYEKKYATPEQWLQTNGDTIIMSSLGFNNRVWTFGSEFSCALSVSDYSHPALTAPVLEWAIEADGQVWAQGSLAYDHKPYESCPAGLVRAIIPTFARPTPARLTARLSEQDRVFTNQWDLWFFPEAADLPAGAVETNTCEPAAQAILTNRLTPELTDYVRSGGNVILGSSEGLVRPFLQVLGLTEGRYFFTKPANFPPLEELQAGTIIRDHPMLGDFPHENFADLQFYNLIGESPAFDIGSLGLNDEDPVIRMLHSSFVARPLALLLERSLGKGRIIMTAMDMDRKFPEARYLLKQICRYALGGDKPACAEMSESTLEKLLAAGELAGTQTE